MRAFVTKLLRRSGSGADDHADAAYAAALLIGGLKIDGCKVIPISYLPTSCNSPVTESMMKPRTDMSEGISGWPRMAATVDFTDFSVS